MLYGYQIAEKLSEFGEAVYKSLQEIVCIDQCPKKIGLHQYIVCNLSISQNQLFHKLVSGIFSQAYFYPNKLVFHTYIDSIPVGKSCMPLFPCLFQLVT